VLQIALLRAVNVANRNMVAMSDLRAMAERLGLAKVQTLLQSGNLVFDGKPGGAKLETLLESEAKKRLKVETDFFVRTAGEWRALIAANPFPAEAKKDPSHLVLLCLKDAPGKPALEALRQAIKGREQVETDGRQAYAVYPDGIGRSKLTAALIEKHLGTRGTGRNWNTVLKLAALTRET
jgi:uncharacterized protein (DUF1697 family)